MNQAKPKSDARTHQLSDSKLRSRVDHHAEGAFRDIRRMNREWVSRIQSEAKLASDFVTKLIAARSIPDAASALQECATRQFEMFTEDSRRLLADSQKLIETGTRFFTAPQVAGT